MARVHILVGVVLALLHLPGQIYAAEEVREKLILIVQANPLEVAVQRARPHFEWHRLSELELLGTGAIRFYQRYIATQDLPVCNFYPSCSQFGAQSIQRYGFARGVLLTADRLLRDNGLVMHRHYAQHEESGRFCDPVEDYVPEALK